MSPRSKLICYGLGIVWVAACSPRPDRVDPQDFDGATWDSDSVPVPNDCTTLTNAFDMRSSGYVEATEYGYATYEYEAVPDRLTTVYLRSCDPTLTERYLTLAYYGIERVQVGTHEVNRFAEEEGGVNFAFTDASGETTVNCDELPEGEVTITESTFGTLSGSFELEAYCMDESLIGRRPQLTTFRGKFSANNIGLE